MEIERLRILDMFLLYPSLLHKTSMPQDTKKLFRELDVTAPDKLFVRLPSTAAVFQDLRLYQNSAIAQLTARGLFSTDDLKMRLASPPSTGWPDTLVRRALHKNADDGGLTSFLVGAFSDIPLRGRESIYRKAGLPTRSIAT
ncbi:MAG: hypothetical protein EON93_12570 [Burkholderiales bacterium]|nr:MAG: hypothetical protein EON93_12570 [Burkholderiales bacterium]